MKVIFKTTPHTRKFGVELEVSPDLHKTKIGHLLEDFEMFYGSSRRVKVTSGAKGWEDTNSNDYWHVKYDSTCGPIGKSEDHGWEIASFIGISQSDLNDISEAGSWLKSQGVSTNKNCGYHIHIDVSDLTPENIGLMIARWLKIEFCVMSACASQRLSNQYCQFLNIRKITQNAIYNPLNLKRFWDDMAPQNLGIHDNPDKRYTVNPIGYRIGQINPMHPRKTVEFRFPECLLDENHIKNWVHLLLCFVDNCCNFNSVPENIQKSTSVSEVLQILGLEGSESFYFLDKELFDTKIWFLNKIISQSAETCYSKQASELLAFILEI